MCVVPRNVEFKNWYLSHFGHCIFSTALTNSIFSSNFFRQGLKTDCDDGEKRDRTFAALFQNTATVLSDLRLMVL